MDELKPCRVKWLDHASVSGWRSVEDFPRVGFEVESIGWLVFESDDVLVLAASVGETKAADFTVIVKSCIIERWEL